MFCRLLIFSKSTFLKIVFRHTIKVANSLYQSHIRPDILLGLIWVQTVCEGYKQMSLVDKIVEEGVVFVSPCKERLTHRGHDSVSMGLIGFVVRGLTFLVSNQ